VVLLLAAAAWRVQVLDPEKFNKGMVVNAGERVTILFAVLVGLTTVWLVTTSWEQHIHRKTRRPFAELSLVERFYGGTVFVRRLPRRVWNAAQNGDRLVKPAGSLLIRVLRRGEPVAPP
jgi:hypothetical protein